MLKRLYNWTSGSLSGVNTGILQGGAGVQTAGVTSNPGISGPRIEEKDIEVLDVTAPSQIGASGTVLGTPAASGKYLVLSPLTSSFGARWKLQGPTPQQRIPYTTGGVVVTSVDPQSSTNNTMGFATGTVAGNEAASGAKAVVRVEGPVQAFVESLVGGSAISAGMFLAADGAGNLTYAGASPNAGSVVGIYTGPLMASSVSIPVLSNVYLGNF